ncbi:MAG: aminopeptidase N [Proteobacteria bacterium]|nr:MAG: aminopeptidase N [Pseudomonadota bacterium]PIE40186.1 MAG: aminopeptidase N [Gammaproteobacteria bacterium]
MKDAQPGTIYLSEYQPPLFLINETDLHFDLFEESAVVTARLSVQKNPARNSDLSRSLVLSGIELELVSLAVDGAPLSKGDYSLNEEELIIHSVPDSFELTCVNRIKPGENTCLEGLYKSSGMFCSQCEAEGFRRITFYLDRPDVMSRFCTTIVADKKRYPVLLSNGNKIKSGDLADGRHFATWHDPFKKPCYLFALVAGDLHLHQDRFMTCSGREIDLRMYVESHNSDKCDFAMTSLKKAMEWDEQVYGLEYDLDVFMIVAVDDFNMGAMENKGLNIFNSSCVLARPDASTDGAYQRIEGIVAHEYFHNWSGNRVTCRDWFQLSLKEGFTVFRDSEFSADMGARTIKRIEDVNLLRTAQFAEDAGPMAHPVRPSSYIEISNFYTLTVYEKGAEVVRMIHRLLGAEAFRKGSDHYFARHDGQAVTTEDFVVAMEEASGVDLSLFRRWYDQAGTPVLDVSDEFDQAEGEYRITVTQSCPATPGQPEKLPFHIPFAIGLMDDHGQDIRVGAQPDGNFSCQPENGGGGNHTEMLELRDTSRKWCFSGLTAKPHPSFLRGFSAPVRLNYDYSRDELMFLMSHDSDGFNRWDAGQKLATSVIQELIARQVEGVSVDGSMVDHRLIEAYRISLGPKTERSAEELALLAKMMLLPTEQFLTEISVTAHVDEIHAARNLVSETIAHQLRLELKDLYLSHNNAVAYRFDPISVAQRSLKNSALSWLLKIDDEEALEWALQQYSNATNMTDRSGALVALMESSFMPERDAALGAFYQAWKEDAQVVEMWFALQCGHARTGTLKRVKDLMRHPAFEIRNPNKVRSVIGTFAGQSLVNFHDLSGEGYRFLADRVIELDKQNSQIAARLAIPLTRWKKYSVDRQTLLKAELERILRQPQLSKDVYEIASKGKNN